MSNDHSEYSDKRNDFNYELEICFRKPVLFSIEANNLFYCAEVLLDFESEKLRGVQDVGLSRRNDILAKAYFPWRTIRMLWAYGFENLLKHAILLRYRVQFTEATKVPMKRIQNHDLLKLAFDAGITLNDNEKFHLRVLTLCSKWAGRYPLPVKLEDMPESRNPCSTREELIKREIHQIQLLKDGKIARLQSEADVLSTGVGETEIRLYRTLKLRIEEYISSLSG